MNNTMQAMMTIAENAFRDTKFGKAEFFLKRLEREGRVSNEDDEALAIAIENLATAQMNLRKFPTAIASFERALKERKLRGLLNQSSRVRLYYKIAEVHMYNRNYFRCEQYLKKAWSLDAKRGSNLNQLWRLIVTLSLQNKIDEEQYYRKLFLALKQQQGMIADALAPNAGNEDCLQSATNILAVMPNSNAMSQSVGV